MCYHGGYTFPVSTDLTFQPLSSSTKKLFQLFSKHRENWYILDEEQNWKDSLIDLFPHIYLRRF